MNITNVTITTTAEEITANASYILQYSVTNGALTQAQATVLELNSPKSGNQLVIGTIYLEQDLVTCNLPKERNLAPFFADFDLFIKSIRESILPIEN